MTNTISTFAGLLDGLNRAAQVAQRKLSPPALEQERVGPQIVPIPVVERPIPQNDPALPKEIQLWGCFFRSALRWCEIHAGRLLTREEIVVAYTRALQANGPLTEEQRRKGQYVMLPNCTMGRRHTLVFAIGLDVLGVEGVVVHQVGAVRPGGPIGARAYNPSNYWQWVRGTSWQRSDFTILRGRTRRVPGHPELGLHFRYGDGDGRMEWDPYEPNPEIIEETATYIYAVGA